jgi:hypothetical protein
MGLDKSFEPVLRFMVVSDIHVHDTETVERERFANAIRYAYDIAESSGSYKKLDALYIVGDFADNGSEASMRATKDIIDRNVKEGTKVILTMASHEYKFDGEEGARRRFAEIFTQPFDTHEVINGFHFIAVTTTGGCNFKEPQKAFARGQLKAAAADDSRKPIFFFQHPHITDTVYGSINWGEDELTAILMDYPQIINFSGHSHAPINDPRSIHQRHFTSLGTGTLSYFELDEFDKITGTIPDDDDKAAQMLIVEADAQNRVRIYPFDVLTNGFFPYTWKIDVPSDPSTFLYTDDRYKTTSVPRFADDAVCSFECADGSVTISFPQAIPADGEQYVNSYDIVIRRSSDNEIVRQLSVWSGYYFTDMPKKISRTVTGLDGGTEYTAEIYPSGFFKNRSRTPLRGAFKTT